MNYLLHIYRIVLLLLPTCLLSIEVSSTQQGSSYFFYQQPQYPRDCKEARDQCSSDNLSGVYTIKPDGYPEPFEVYCDNDASSGGWTVIQRLIDGSLTFTRRWEDYRNGFGFLSSEFWIGNEKLSHLTNQAVYELHIYITLSNGSSFYVNYNSFRISDELCPLKNFAVIGNGESLINVDCTQNCTCIDNQLTCNGDYECSADATCSVKEGIRKCYCNECFEGNGERCPSNVFKDCYEAFKAGHTTDGIYTIMPTGWPGSSFDVFCNMTFGDGGWTVFQRRIDGVTDFYRNWTEYQQGFGTLNQGNDFWLGNEQLHYLTDQKNYILRIDFVDSSDRLFYEEYNTFKIGDNSDKYRLSYSSQKSRNTGYSNILYYNNGQQFSTRDQDNDGCNNHDYAERHRGGWWYTDNSYLCNTYCYSSYCYYFEYGSSGCHTLGTDTNLNGDYNGGNGENIFYYTYYDGVCNHKFAEMKIRPVNT